MNRSIYTKVCLLLPSFYNSSFLMLYKVIWTPSLPYLCSFPCFLFYFDMSVMHKMQIRWNALFSQLDVNPLAAIREGWPTTSQVVIIFSTWARCGTLHLALLVLLLCSLFTVASFVCVLSFYYNCCLLIILAGLVYESLFKGIRHSRKYQAWLARFFLLYVISAYLFYRFAVSLLIHFVLLFFFCFFWFILNLNFVFFFCFLFFVFCCCFCFF